MVEKKTLKWPSYVWMAAVGIGLLIGLWGGAMVLIKGHELTMGTTRDVPWGIFIAGFAFFVGASAGATIIGLMIHVFARQDYRSLGTRALLVGLLSLMAAVLFLIVDIPVVKLPIMLLVPWVLGNPTSMFLYTATTYYLFGLILLAELYCTVKIIRGNASNMVKKMSKWLAIVAVPFALWVLHAPHGALFGVIKAREYWNTPLLPPHFAIAALATGTAIIIVIAIATPKISQRGLVSRETLDHLGKLLAFFITVTIFFDFFDILVSNYSRIPEIMEAWSLLTGRYAPLFVLNIGGLFVALLILLFKQGRSVKGLFIASLLALAAIAAYRYNIVIVGELVPLRPGHEIHYSPTGVEISLTVGIVALVMLLYTVLTRVLPLEET